ncbi:MAG: universal stress protein, partial [Halobacteria archaeon]|nr:universal stress protein [Halobacteria archaeon]
MKYVVAVDGSDESDEAVRYAVEIAGATESELHVVHSVTPEIYSESGEVLIEDMSEAESRSRELTSRRAYFTLGRLDRARPS